MKKCKCGCGSQILDKNTYIKGHHNKGKKFSKETCRKISESQKEKSHFHKYNKTEEHRQKVIKSNKNRIVTEETKKKISDTLAGFHHTEETKLKMKITHTDKDNFQEKNNYWKGGEDQYGYGWQKLSKGTTETLLQRLAANQN